MRLQTVDNLVELPHFVLYLYPLHTEVDPVRRSLSKPDLFIQKVAVDLLHYALKKRSELLIDYLYWWVLANRVERALQFQILFEKLANVLPALFGLNIHLPIKRLVSFGAVELLKVLAFYWLSDQIPPFWVAVVVVEAYLDFVVQQFKDGLS